MASNTSTVLKLRVHRETLARVRDIASGDGPALRAHGHSRPTMQAVIRAAIERGLPIVARELEASAA